MKEGRAKLTLAARAFVLSAATCWCLSAWGESSGIFGAGQVQRGAALYTSQCAGCHGADLSGGANRSPPLRGEPFWSKWDGRVARKIYSLVITTMPANDPGSLTEPEALDVVAFILNRNGIPSAATDIEHARQLDALTLQKPASP